MENLCVPTYESLYYISPCTLPVFQHGEHDRIGSGVSSSLCLLAVKLNTRNSLQTGKRDHLKSLEKKYQKRWADEHIFEVNAPSQDELAGLSRTEIQEKFPKWFGSFPFPYMNGSLHLGHAFTITKIEFAAGYQRLLGKRVLFPHGFHVTGMPIKVRYLKEN